MTRHIFLRLFFSLALALSVLACSRPYSLSRLPVATPVPYQLSLEFSSALEDLYYVMSGPAFTYARFPVNERMTALLKAQTQRQSSLGASGQAVLRVRIEKLQTMFDEIGLKDRPRKPILVAMAGTVVSDAGRLFLISDIDSGGDFPLPVSTRKTVRMTLLLQVEKAGQQLGEKRVVVEFTEAHHWYDEDSVSVDYYRYNFEPVLDEVYRKALAEVGAFVEQTLGN